MPFLVLSAAYPNIRRAVCFEPTALTCVDTTIASSKEPAPDGSRLPVHEVEIDPRSASVVLLGQTDTVVSVASRWHLRH